MFPVTPYVQSKLGKVPLQGGLPKICVVITKPIVQSKISTPQVDKEEQSSKEKALMPSSSTQNQLLPWKQLHTIQYGLHNAPQLRERILWKAVEAKTQQSDTIRRHKSVRPTRPSTPAMRKLSATINFLSHLLQWYNNT